MAPFVLECIPNIFLTIYTDDYANVPDQSFIKMTLVELLITFVARASDQGVNRSASFRSAQFTFDKMSELD